ncbi:MAG TPA: hypothetical protein DCS66_06705 [Flavobacteriaceae bacterium]|jgi:ribosomal protein S27E|nr:hypothetical protein [Flavobacteriaceae bacterium]|tara:strand:+ start:695 stop:1093 length:399 start_codon:yes stop_codon:yes gene_type:complete
MKNTIKSLMSHAKRHLKNEPPMQKVNRNTRAGNHGKIIQCPKCNHQSVSYHFSFAASGCTGCGEIINKNDYLLPTITKEKDARVRKAHRKDNAIRRICYKTNKHLFKSGDINKYWVAFDKLYKHLSNKAKKK